MLSQSWGRSSAQKPKLLPLSIPKGTMLPDQCSSAQPALPGAHWETSSTPTSPESGIVMRKPTFQVAVSVVGPEGLQVAPVVEAVEVIPEADDEGAARVSQQQQQMQPGQRNSLTRTVSMPHGPHNSSNQLRSGQHLLRTRTTCASAREKVTKRYPGGQLPPHTDHLSPTSEVVEEPSDGRDRTLSVASHATTEGSEIDSDQERARDSGKEKDKTDGGGKSGGKSGGGVMKIFRRLSQKVGKGGKRPDRFSSEHDSDLSDASKASAEHLQPQHVRFHMESGEHLDVPPQATSIASARHSPMLLPPRLISDSSLETRPRRMQSVCVPPRAGASLLDPPDSDGNAPFKGVPRTNRSPSSSFLEVSSSSTAASAPFAASASTSSGGRDAKRGGLLAFFGLDGGGGDKYRLEVLDLTVDSMPAQSCRTFRNQKQFLEWHRGLHSKLQQSYSSHAISAHDVDRAAGFTPSLTKSHTAHPSLLNMASPQNPDSTTENKHRRFSQFGRRLCVCCVRVR